MEDSRIQEWHDRRDEYYAQDCAEEEALMDREYLRCCEMLDTVDDEWRPSELAMELVHEVLRKGGWL